MLEMWMLLCYSCRKAVGVRVRFWEWVLVEVTWTKSSSVNFTHEGQLIYPKETTQSCIRGNEQSPFLLELNPYGLKVILTIFPFICFF